MADLRDWRCGIVRKVAISLSSEANVVQKISGSTKQVTTSLNTIDSSPTHCLSDLLCK